MEEQTMSSEPAGERPVVRITRMSIACSTAGRDVRGKAEAERWTIYGIDEDGIEHVYAEHITEEEHEAWWAADPLWREAQAALFRRLLDDPKMRDLVIQINIRAALDAGDAEMASKLVSYLSLEVPHRLIGQDDRAGTNTDPGTHGT